MRIFMIGMIKNDKIITNHNNHKNQRSFYFWFGVISFILLPFFPAFCQQIKRPVQFIENRPKYDRARFHFGFMLGLNNTNFVVRNNPDLNKLGSVYIIDPVPQLGFDLGIVSDLRIGKLFDLRFIPTLSFCSRKINYTFYLNSIHGLHDSLDWETKSIESTFLEFPVFMKFKSWKIRNGRAYVLAGGKFTYDLASQKKVQSNDVIVKLEKYDVGFEVGFGLDLYLEYFKFSPEIKASFGQLNMLVHDNTTFSNSIQQLKTKSIMISFYFE